jgi:hypothetical protein
MRRKPRSFRSVILFAALLSSLAAHADDLPPRKAGLWEMKDRLADPTIPELTTQQCIGAASEKKSSSAPADQEVCSSYDIRKTAAGYVVDAVCRSGNLTTSWHSEIQGDLNSHYVATSTTRSQRGTSAPPVELTTITDAKWLGDCKPDQQPGDLIITGGPKMKVEDAEKMGMIPMGRPR